MDTEEAEQRALSLPGEPREPKSAQMSPVLVLVFFSAMSFLIYLDRGCIASNGVNGSPRTVDDPNGSGLQGAFDLSFFEDGLLPAAFMVGLLVASPVFAEGSKHYNAMRLIGYGLLVWSAAVVGCALAWDFRSLALFRMAVGVGEASFVALAAPFIDDHAPPARRTVWLAAFYLQIPVGVAAGYVYGGTVGAAMGWRAAFALEAALMAPFVAFCLWGPPLPLTGGVDMPALEVAGDEEAVRGEGRSAARLEGVAETGDGSVSGGGDGGAVSGTASDEAALPLLARGAESASASSDSAVAATSTSGRAAEGGAVVGNGWRARLAGHSRHAASRLRTVSQSFWQDVVETCSHRVYLYTVASASIYTGVLGFYSYWGPKAGKALFGMQQESADLVFGALTVLTGVIGTAAGGVALDRLGGGMESALALSAAAVAVACALLIPAFNMAQSIGQFAPMLALGELALFLTQAPTSAVALWCVPKRLRPFSCSLTTVLIHLLGDVPSPPIMGAVQGHLRNWRLSFSLLTAALLAEAALLVAGARAARHAPDYRNTAAGH